MMTRAYSQSAQVPLLTPTPLPRQQRRPQNPNARAIENLVNPEVWTTFDTCLISPSTAAGVTTTNVPFANWVNVTNPIPFFSARTIANSGFGITSMTTASGYVDFPYKAYGIGVHVFAQTDIASGANSQFTARQFCESVINGGTMQLSFAGDTKFAAPINDLPSGGGAVSLGATDSRATGANQTAAGAINGLQTVQARALWKDYILFRGKDQPFAAQVVLNPVAFALIQATNSLQAMTGNQFAGIQIKFWGYRGKSLVIGSPYRG